MPEMQFADQLTLLATSVMQTSTAARGILHRHLGSTTVHSRRYPRHWAAPFILYTSVFCSPTDPHTSKAFCRA